MICPYKEKNAAPGIEELNGNQAGLAYLFSLSAAKYLIDTIGLYRVEDILNDLAAGADTGKAISKESLLQRVR